MKAIKNAKIELPPSIQRSILGTLLLRPELYYGVSDHLRPFMFGKGLRKVAEQMFEQLQEGDEVNLHQFSDSYQFGVNCDQLKKAYLCRENIRLLHQTADRLITEEDSSRIMADFDSQRKLLQECTRHQNPIRQMARYP